MEAVDIVPGDRSVAGRQLSRSLARLRSEVCRDGTWPRAAKAQGEASGPEPAAEPEQPKLDASFSGILEASRTLGGASPARRRLDATLRPGDTARSQGPSSPTGAGASPTAQPAEDGAEAAAGRPRPSILSASEELAVPQTSGKPSPAFTSIGHSSERYCEMTRMLSGRFAFPQKLEQRPEVGRYAVKHGDKGLRAVKERHPEWDFRRRPSHPTRKLPDTSYEVDPFGTQDIFDPNISSFHGASSSRSSGPQPMGCTTKRPALEQSQGRTFRDEIQMNEIPFHAGEWSLHDVPSSKRWRLPDWDVAKHSSSHVVEFMRSYYEPGKYAVRRTCVEQGVKDGVGFSRSLSRACSAGQLGHASGQLGHLAPKAVLHKEGPEGNGKASIRDRSKARDGPLTRSRMLHVNDFAKEMPRPPLINASGVYHDLDDPEACAAVFQRDLTFDANSADHAVVPRNDYAPNMGQSLSRDRAGRGDRIFQDDPGLRMSRGLVFPESESQIEASVEQAKEVPSRCRPDMGVSFDQCKGRVEASPLTQKRHSSLRQPRGNAAPDFTRSAPLIGFATATNVERPMVGRWKRTHEALPSWAAESVDEAEGRPPP